MNAAQRAAWNRIRRSWPAQAQRDLDEGVQTHMAAVRSRPSSYRDDLNRFIGALTRSYERLEKLRPYVSQGVVDRAAFERMERQYEILGAGVFSGAYQVDDPVLAGPPVLLILGGIGFIAAAIIWAVVAWEQAQVLDRQTGVMEQELYARVEASRNGRELQPSTLEYPPADPGLFNTGGLSTGTKVGLGVGMVVLLGLGGVALYSAKA